MKNQILKMKSGDARFENENLKKDNDFLREENRRLKILLAKYKNQIQQNSPIKQDDIVWERVNSDNPIFDMTPEELKQFKFKQEAIYGQHPNHFEPLRELIEILDRYVSGYTANDFIEYDGVVGYDVIYNVQCLMEKIELPSIKHKVKVIKKNNR